MCLLGSGTGRSPQAALVIAGTSPSVEESVTSGHTCFENLTQLTLAAVCEDCGLDQ